jgi:hypothetical protein
MAKVKTYWDEIKNDECTFYGGRQGWEVRMIWTENWKYNPKTGESILVKQLVLQWPFGVGDGVPGEEKAQCRKEVNFKKRRRKILAQAAQNRTEYEDLLNRVYKLSMDDFNEIIKKDLKGYELRNYIQLNYLTDGEAYASFWRM